MITKVWISVICLRGALESTEEFRSPGMVLTKIQSIAKSAQHMLGPLMTGYRRICLSPSRSTLVLPFPWWRRLTALGQCVSFSLITVGGGFTAYVVFLFFPFLWLQASAKLPLLSRFSFVSLPFTFYTNKKTIHLILIMSFQAEPKPYNPRSQFIWLAD